MKIAEQRANILKALTQSLDSCIAQAEAHGNLDITSMAAHLTFVFANGGFEVASRPKLDFTRDLEQQLTTVAREV